MATIPFIQRTKPEDLLCHVVACPVSGDREQPQFDVENNRKMIRDWDREYVAFGGFFGTHGPYVFAAAPELLDLVRQYRNDLLYPVADDSRIRRLAAIDAVLAKVAAS